MVCGFYLGSPFVVKTDSTSQWFWCNLRYLLTCNFKWHSAKKCLNNRPVLNSLACRKSDRNYSETFQRLVMSQEVRAYSTWTVSTWLERFCTRKWSKPSLSIRREKKNGCLLHQGRGAWARQPCECWRCYCGAGSVSGRAAIQLHPVVRVSHFTIWKIVKLQ